MINEQRNIFIIGWEKVNGIDHLVTVVLDYDNNYGYKIYFYKLENVEMYPEDTVKYTKDGNDNLVIDSLTDETLNGQVNVNEIPLLRKGKGENSDLFLLISTDIVPKLKALQRFNFDIDSCKQLTEAVDSSIVSLYGYNAFLHQKAEIRPSVIDGLQNIPNLNNCQKIFGKKILNNKQ
ncbi:MAG: hypothetical protein EZS28_026477 [Streblomastix strix]|uniref:Uncharacterized protein n=1 Tax=Streblomastix strix TaxID=222440 RepID=A0A5J4V5X3_9EUKA|nr:MAG: hypothetical protein EZS28_026477 [Streblomastix strix]